MDQVDQFADMGITCIWLPPPTDSVSPQGYMPGDLYNLNSKYGSQEDLKRYSSITTYMSILLLHALVCCLEHLHIALLLQQTAGAA